MNNKQNLIINIIISKISLIAGLLLRVLDLLNVGFMGAEQC